MSISQCLVVAQEAESGVETRPDELRNAGLESKLEDPHAPVDLGLLPEDEGVEVCEDVGGAAEGGGREDSEVAGPRERAMLGRAGRMRAFGEVEVRVRTRTMSAGLAARAGSY
jgi:hypothetical protein